METFIIPAVLALVGVLWLFIRYRKLKRELYTLSRREHDDFANMCRAFEEQQNKLDEISAGLEEERTNGELAEMNRAADKQAALYTQGINNILGYGGRMGAE